MKLRIRGNSLRYRITRSELAKLMASGRIEETVHFSCNEQYRFTYALEHDLDVGLPTVRCQLSEVVVVLPEEQARSWAEGDVVGIYHAVNLGVRGLLELIVEKDFACLDGNDAENRDTFPNPNAGAIC